MNQIPQRQQEAGQVERLQAQRWLYDRSKRLRQWQFIVAAVVPIFLVVPLEHPEVPSYLIAALVAAAAGVTEVMLHHRRKALRLTAARIQEAFDCYVLELPTRLELTGAEPAAGEVREAAEALRRAAAGGRQGLLAGIVPWYAEAAGALPLERGRLECQRENAWWDDGTRRLYVRWLLWFASAEAVVALGLGWLTGWLLGTPGHLPSLLGRFVLYFAPLTIWTVREVLNQHSARTQLGRIAGLINQAETAAREGQASSEAFRERSRAIQDLIFLNRSRAAEVVEWLYSRARASQEANMRADAQRKAAEAARSGSQATGAAEPR